jgi:hypothetical protein
LGRAFGRPNAASRSPFINYRVVTDLSAETCDEVMKLRPELPAEFASLFRVRLSDDFRT